MESRPKRKKHYDSGLTQAEIEAMRQKACQMWLSGGSCNSIARDLGTSNTTVWRWTRHLAQDNVPALRLSVIALPGGGYSFSFVAAPTEPWWRRGDRRKQKPRP